MPSAPGTPGKPSDQGGVSKGDSARIQSSADVSRTVQSPKSLQEYSQDFECAETLIALSQQKNPSGAMASSGGAQRMQSAADRAANASNNSGGAPGTPKK